MARTYELVIFALEVFFFVSNFRSCKLWTARENFSKIERSNVRKYLNIVGNFAVILDRLLVCSPMYIITLFCNLFLDLLLSVSATSLIPYNPIL